MTPSALRLGIDDLYARFVDAVARRSASDLARLFTPDACVEGPLEAPRHGVDAIVASLTAGFAHWEMLLLVPQATVVVDEGPPVRTRWHLLEIGRRSGDDVLYAGVYHDELARHESGWRFDRRRFDLVYARTGAGATVPPPPTAWALGPRPDGSGPEGAGR